MNKDRQKLMDENPAMRSAIADLTPDMKPIVKDIESGIKTTQDHYGNYMASLSRLVPDSNDRMLFVVSCAMIKAGANENGVNSALRIISGHS